MEYETLPQAIELVFDGSELDRRMPGFATVGPSGNFEGPLKGVGEVAVFKFSPKFSWKWELIRKAIRRDGCVPAGARTFIKICEDRVLFRAWSKELWGAGIHPLRFPGLATYFWDCPPSPEGYHLFGYVAERGLKYGGVERGLRHGTNPIYVVTIRMQG